METGKRSSRRKINSTGEWCGPCCAFPGAREPLAGDGGRIAVCPQQEECSRALWKGGMSCVAGLFGLLRSLALLLCSQDGDAVLPVG